MSLFKRIFGKGGECKDPQSRAAEALDKKLHDLELDKYGIDPYTALLHVLE